MKHCRELLRIELLELLELCCIPVVAHTRLHATLEDLNDQNLLRADPLLAALAARADPTGTTRRRPRKTGKPLAGKTH